MWLSSFSHDRNLKSICALRPEFLRGKSLAPQVSCGRVFRSRCVGSEQHRGERLTHELGATGAMRAFKSAPKSR